MKRLLLLNDRCIQEQTEQYRLLSQGDRKLRKFRHDYNSHITALQSLAAAGDTEGLTTYIGNLAEAGEGSRLISTGNIIGDAILNRYAGLCAESGISLKTDGKFPERMPISETDLCILLSNSLSNAYEAAEKCSGERWISFQTAVSENGQWLMIWLSNTAVSAPVMEAGGLRSDKEDRTNHGFGTRSMLETASRNSGEIHWTYDESGIVKEEILLQMC